MFKKFSLIICTIVLMSSLIGVKAYAYTGYSNYDRYFMFSSGQATYVARTFSSYGYATPDPSNISFTKSNVLSSVAAVRCFYVSGHGNIGKICTGYNGAESITYSEMAAKTSGFYKFVYTDSCLTGSDGNMASAFNIKNGDGQNHAFLGWNKVIQDDFAYSDFTEVIMEQLAYGKNNLNDSVWAAHVDSGCTGYAIYGTYYMTWN